MQRISEYALLFVALVLAQVLFFDHLTLSPYLYPLVYVGFILFLPPAAPRWATLLLGFAVGLVMDMLSGTAGIHTIASLATGFMRPVLFGAVMGRDVAHDAVAMPLPTAAPGQGRWLRYIAFSVALHCVLFYFFEAGTLAYAWRTLLRIAGSTAVTVALLWVLGILLPSYRRSAA